MPWPDLLASKWGRMTAFFFLYVTEGIPLGFAATAIATQMRRQGVGPAEIGAFVAALYAPWAFKWAFGPVVDVITSERLGRRRMWIVLTQLLMVATLLVGSRVDFSADVALFTTIVIIFNVFCATQDVAIDALAVGTLKPDERGLANGLMFAGAYVGQGLGGAGVLFLTAWMEFRSTFYVVAAMILAVTVFIALPLKEARGTTSATSGRPGLIEVGRRIGGFIRESARAILGTRSGFVALLFALLPAGAYAMSLSLQSNLAVELGLDDPSVAKLNLWSSVLAALGCVAGGLLSDRFGRRRMLALYIVLMAVPTLYMAWELQKHGWVMPVDPQAAGRAVAVPALVFSLWIASLVYNLLNGLMYGARMALFMDVTNPAVAATQFTAYMALMNLVISYSAGWQGKAAEAWGYPVTLGLDAGFGMVCLALLPFIRPPEKAPASVAAAGP